MCSGRLESALLISGVSDDSGERLQALPNNNSCSRYRWGFRSVLMGNRGNLLGRRPGSAIVRRSESKIAPMSMSNLGDCLLARQCFKQHKASSRHLPSQTEPSADVEKQY